MIWYLLGAGSMGSLAAFYLRATGFEVAVLGPANPDPLMRQLRFATDSSVDPAEQSLQLPWAQPEKIDYLLLATKAGQTRAALAPWLSCLSQDATLLCLQNGMGQLNDIALPQGAHILPAITTNGAYREGERITLVAENTTFVGDGSAQPPAWFERLAAHWPGLEWRADIREKQLAKLAINAIINPLTALHRCHNGELLSAALRPQFEALAAEVDSILSAMDSNWPGDSLAHAKQVAELTAGNTSSMLADVKAGRATEIAFINGYLLREAERLGLLAPLNRALVAQLG